MRTGGLLLLLSGLAVPLALAGGCGDPCEDLQSICNDCADETYRNACQRDVDDNVQSLCDNRVAFYRQQCPAPLPTTTTTTTTTTAATGGGSDVGGAGGMSAGGMGGMSAGGSGGSGGAGGG